MATVFLDTNVFIDIRERTELIDLNLFQDDQLIISPLTIHVYCYTYNKKIPSAKVAELVEVFTLVDFTQDIVQRSLEGPTNDFEDNVQLHSAVAAECDAFYTRDKKLLTLGYFGAVQIKNPIHQS